MKLKVKELMGETEQEIEDFIANSIKPDCDRLDTDFEAQSYAIEYLDNLNKSHAKLISILTVNGDLKESDLIELNKVTSLHSNVSIDLVRNTQEVSENETTRAHPFEPLIQLVSSSNFWNAIGILSAFASLVMLLSFQIFYDVN